MHSPCMLYKKELWGGRTPLRPFQSSFVRPFINHRDTLTKDKERTVAPNTAFSAQFGKLSKLELDVELPPSRFNAIAIKAVEMKVKGSPKKTVDMDLVTAQQSLELLRS